METHVLFSLGTKTLPGCHGHGNKGDKREKWLLKQGFVVEVIDMTGDQNDGGPISLCVCNSVAAAQEIVSAIQLHRKLSK